MTWGWWGCPEWWEGAERQVWCALRREAVIAAWMESGFLQGGGLGIGGVLVEGR